MKKTTIATITAVLLLAAVLCTAGCVEAPSDPIVGDRIAETDSSVSDAVFENGDAGQRITMRSFEDAAAFHGHVCGGLALGYKAALYAAELLDLSFSQDEEVVCIAETDSCAVDAIQTVLGCTAGKGNLIVHQWGKNAFSFYNRESGRSLRLVQRPDAMLQSDEMKGLRDRVFSETASEEEQIQYQALRLQQVEDILRTPPEMLFIVKDTSLPLPAPSVIQDSVVCSVCGEPAAKGLCSVVGRKYVCKPCVEKDCCN